MLATEELRQRYHNHSAAFDVTARQLAEFLQSVEAQETLLTQRLSDLESKTIRLTLTNVAGNGGCGASATLLRKASGGGGQPTAGGVCK